MRRFSIVLVLVCVLGGASAAGAAASGWSIQPSPNPNPNGGVFPLLAGVSCTSASACIAVGSYSNGTTTVALAERWNGAKWSVEPTPIPSGATSWELYGVSCTSASACIAGGSYSNGTAIITLAERWNGTKWSIQPTPNPHGASVSELYGVSCTSASACTAVGYYDNGGWRTLAERWNGAKWSIEHTPNPSGATRSLLSGVSCTSTSACTAAGYYVNGANHVLALAERWNGTKWSIQQTPNLAGEDVSLSSISCSSGNACTAVGSYRVQPNSLTLAERWNGTKWSIQHTPNPTGEGPLLGVSCSAASACTAVGPGTLAERWNGTTWSIQHTPNPSGALEPFLNGVSCTSKRSCTAWGSYFNGTTIVTLAERWKRP